MHVVRPERARARRRRPVNGERPPGAKSIDQLLEEARSRISRVTPHEAVRGMAAGAVPVDIRPQAQR